MQTQSPKNNEQTESPPASPPLPATEALAQHIDEITATASALLAQSGCFSRNLRLAQAIVQLRGAFAGLLAAKV